MRKTTNAKRSDTSLYDGFAMVIKVERPTAAQRPNTRADIVFCIDATTSMKPCFEALVANLDTFIASLQTEASVDIRLRLVGFRDLHDPTCEYGWDIHEFTENVAQFRSQLSKLEAKCGQKSRGAESSLDALFFAIHSDWRKSKTHRTIILITDDDAYDKLHASLYNRPDNGVERVIQDIQEMRHSMLFMVCPRFAIYRRIADSMVSADRKIAAVWVSNKDGETYQELANLNWASLLKMLGQSISKTSITVT